MSAALSMASEPPKKMPKLVSEVHELIQLNPGSPPTDMKVIKNALSKQKYNTLGNTFRNSLTEEQKTTYKTLTTKQKDEWLLQFVLDPQLCSLKGFNTNTAYKDDRNEDKEMWVTEDQLAGPQFLNNATHAALVCKSGELDSKDHHWKALADAGVKEYRVTMSQIKRLKGVKESE